MIVFFLQLGIVGCAVAYVIYDAVRPPLWKLLNSVELLMDLGATGSEVRFTDPASGRDFVCRRIAVAGVPQIILLMAPMKLSEEEKQEVQRIFASHEVRLEPERRSFKGKKTRAAMLGSGKKARRIAEQIVIGVCGLSRKSRFKHEESGLFGDRAYGYGVPKRKK